jgi:hypothetical protein
MKAPASAGAFVWCCYQVRHANEGQCEPIQRRGKNTAMYFSSEITPRMITTTRAIP